MNEVNQNPDDARLRALLRESRSSPQLPPRFQDGVWRRIEKRETDPSAGRSSWLDVIASLVFRPRLALAAVAMLVLIGTVFGVREGVQTARHEAQTRYLTAVAPDVLR
jgi:hypothetical protein